jgi:hypothetical protein
MEEVIWVEIVSRHREVVQRFRCTGRGIRIGRAYSNDVILDDPAVAPEHLYVGRDETGALIAEDLGSTTGLFEDRGRVRLRRVLIDPERPLRIGQTYLRIREPGHQVAAERNAAARWRLWPALVVLTLLIAGSQVLFHWLDEVGRPTPQLYLWPLLNGALGVVGWAGGWAVASRIFSGRARFELNLLVALAGLLAYTLYAHVMDLLGGALGWPGTASHQALGLPATAVLCLAVVTLCHLRVIGPAHVRAKLAAVGALAALIIGLDVLPQLDARSDYFPTYQEVARRRLMPPTLMLATPQTEDAYFGDVEKLRAQLELDRERPAP